MQFSHSQGAAGIRTTHNPAVMLAHDKHGYPDDFVSVDEPNRALSAIRIPLNPDVKEGNLATCKLARNQCLESISLSFWTNQVPNLSIIIDNTNCDWLLRQFRRDTFKKCCNEPRDSLRRTEGHFRRPVCHWETSKSESGTRTGVGAAKMKLTTLKNSCTSEWRISESC